MDSCTRAFFGASIPRPPSLLRPLLLLSSFPCLSPPRVYSPRARLPVHPAAWPPSPARLLPRAGKPKASFGNPRPAPSSKTSSRPSVKSPPPLLSLPMLFLPSPRPDQAPPRSIPAWRRPRSPVRRSWSRSRAAAASSTRARLRTTRMTRQPSLAPSLARCTCAPSPSCTASPSSCTQTTATRPGCRGSTGSSRPTKSTTPRCARGNTMYCLCPDNPLARWPAPNRLLTSHPAHACLSAAR